MADNRNPTPAQGTTARQSAKIIPLPGALSEPVQQKRGPGRRPAHIINMHYWRLDHTQPKGFLTQLEDDLNYARASVDTAEYYLNLTRGDLAIAQQRVEQQKSNIANRSK